MKFKQVKPKKGGEYSGIMSNGEKKSGTRSAQRITKDTEEKRNESNQRFKRENKALL